jgi:hypothetical protein
MGDPVDLLVSFGGVAAATAMIGLLLILPLYLTQRREVQRLLEWSEREPDRGDAAAPSPEVTAFRSTESMTPAERVTVDRPALARITAERAALESPSFWRRLVARGPRHPLVLSAIGIAVAATAVVAVAVVIEPGGDADGRGGGFDRASVDVVVLNGSSRPALASKVADTLQAEEFNVVGTGVSAHSAQTIVLHANQQRRAATAIGRSLGVRVIQPFDQAARAAAAGADVVVIAGEDRARA